MIYAIIGYTENSEWINSTWSDAEAATEAVERVRTAQPGINFYIRPVTDTHKLVERNGSIEERFTQYGKLLLNAQYGKTKMDHEEGYPDTPALFDVSTLYPKLPEMRYTAREANGDFTMTELFGTLTIENFSETRTCYECGCEIRDRYSHRQRHVEWHNKLLP